MDRTATLIGRSLGLVMLLAVFAVGSNDASAASDAGDHRTERRALVEVSGSYGKLDELGAWGMATRIAVQAKPYLLLGAGLESARFHADGIVGYSGQSFSQTFQSTFLAGFARLQWPAAVVRIFGELAAGSVLIHSRSGSNYNCRFSSGLGVGLAAGIEADIGHGLTLGVRASARNAGWSQLCAAEWGPYTVDGFVAKSAGMSLGYRF